MRGIHRLVIVIGFLLFWVVLAGIRNGSPPPRPPASIEDIASAAAIAWAIAAGMIYPVVWIVSGFRHQ